MKKIIIRLLFNVLFLSLSACEEGAYYAPVVEISTIEPIPSSGLHYVTSGETLYEIAWRYGLDYRFLARRNQIKSPYTIHVGQLIHLHRDKEEIRKTESTVSLAKETERTFVTSKWIWPTKGKIVNSFSFLNKGVNISGYPNEPIYAAAAGTVVYSGNGLRGYGNLIILKHNSVYLSAYAHNKEVFVKEGDIVKQGQKIAAMGSTGSDKVMLHFEIRRAGKPIDPIKFFSSPIR